MMGLTIDQYRFLVANLIGLTLALPYQKIPKSFRHEFNYLPGILMIYYCFGRQANSLVLFSIVSYVICKITPSRYIGRVTMVSSLIFLSYAHLSRQIIDYGGYVLDISGPFMIAVQKMTSLGFCVQDGQSPDCNEYKKKHAICKMPSFNQFFGYFFHFPSVLCGPMMYYNDYNDFVDTPEDKECPPGRRMAVAKKLTISITCAILHLTLNPKFEVEFLRSSQFLIETPIVIKFCYIFVFTLLSRLKYYVAWHLGEAISNTTGLGFNGYNSEGKPKWDLISNMDLWKFETSLNLRDAINAWNKTTQNWLRKTSYERAPKKIAVILTYTLSAVWHGFYPGYYMTFFSGALFTHSSRNGRRIIKPVFQRGNILPIIYDIITFILTRLTIAYSAFPFVILDFHNNYEIYKSLYFSIHILGVIGVVLGCVVSRK